VVHAEDSEKLALVLDNHSRAELCRFDAAHCFVRPQSGRRLPRQKSLSSEIPEGELTLRHAQGKK
jgi:hypothetical protein